MPERVAKVEAPKLGVDDRAARHGGEREGRVVDGHHLVVPKVHHRRVEVRGRPDGRHRDERERDENNLRGESQRSRGRFWWAQLVERRARRSKREQVERANREALRVGFKRAAIREGGVKRHGLGSNVCVCVCVCNQGLRATRVVYDVVGLKQYGSETGLGRLCG